MRAKEYEFICASCTAEFTILTTEEAIPETCPFCGDDLENEVSDIEEDYEE